ncbi:adenylyltransferase and sulfurtransferase [Propionibacterium cyclohexanicum]|uniref:Adenylyltransferase and sulfurtransferase n=1 Tax=Propionibacterium cyclohexanicum TaxID=64702 RepID=A0A1H9RKJ3_9ACTN|nr:molybdopterin-synthase adenylyltransferase MoeB [Propionibacterium cyclohexanicum]SER72469.1 adenylyltransferase and sulfurtransferase [Propionibacterium cyclohexanicum]
MTAVNESIIPDGRCEPLSGADSERYSRHILLPEVGRQGQERLRAARVLIVGAGGLGAPLALYLAAAGVGTIGLVDFDTVEASNLQRQIIHTTRDIGRPKTASAEESIRAINPGVEVITHQLALSSENALDIVRGYDVVADGTDNYPTRYLLNDAAVFLGKPVVYGSIYRFDGQVTVFDAERGPCYRCVYPSPPPPELAPSCSEGGVLGVLPGLVGTLQATEVLKLLIGGAEPLIGRLLLVEAWGTHFREVALAKNPQCPVCGEHPRITQLIDYDQFCGVGADRAAQPVEGLAPVELKRRIDAGEPVQIVDIREPHERSLAPFPQAQPVPQGQLVGRCEEFDRDVDLVIVCAHGRRSQSAVRALRSAGYPGRLLSLEGGVHAWQRDLGCPVPDTIPGRAGGAARGDVSRSAPHREKLGTLTAQLEGHGRDDTR